MTLDKIRQKVRELHSKTRRQLLGNLALPLILIAFYGLMRQFPMLRPLYAFAIAWSLAGLYFLNRGMWSPAMPEDAALSTGLELYRREVERWRHLSGRSLLWSFGPFVLAIAAAIVPLISLGIKKGMLLNMIPLLALLVIWIVSVVVIRMRQQRELQREVEELNDIERAHR
jgi:hypothetical protein